MAEKDNTTPDTAGAFLCRYCGARFDTKPALTAHEEEDHNQSK